MLPDESKAKSASSLISFFSSKIDISSPPLLPIAAFASTSAPPRASIEQVNRERQKDKEKMIQFKSAGGSQSKKIIPTPLKEEDFTPVEPIKIKSEIPATAKSPSPEPLPVLVPTPEPMATPVLIPISPVQASISPEPIIRSRTNSTTPTASFLAKSNSRNSSPRSASITSPRPASITSQRITQTRTISPTTYRNLNSSSTLSIESTPLSRSSSISSIHSTNGSSTKGKGKKVIPTTGTPRSRAAAAKLLEEQNVGGAEKKVVEKKPFLSKGIGKVGLAGAGRVMTPPHKHTVVTKKETESDSTQLLNFRSNNSKNNSQNNSPTSAVFSLSSRSPVVVDESDTVEDEGEKSFNFKGYANRPLELIGTEVESSK